MVRFLTIVRFVRGVGPAIFYAYVSEDDVVMDTVVDGFWPYLPFWVSVADDMQTTDEDKYKNQVCSLSSNAVNNKCLGIHRCFVIRIVLSKRRSTETIRYRRILLLRDS